MDPRNRASEKIAVSMALVLGLVGCGEKLAPAPGAEESREPVAPEAEERKEKLPPSTRPDELARGILEATSAKGGLVVHVGCGEGKLTAALCADERYLVHGLDTDPKSIEKAREHIKSRVLYGKVSVAAYDGEHLPYIDNLVNLVVAERLGDVSMAEVMRVLCPNGVAYVMQDGKWRKTVKPRPEDIDEWTHYLHDATGNAVSHDTVIGPLRRLQWVGSPRWARHHDRMASMSAMVSANGRIFYVMDEGSRASILLPSRWALVARDAFNSTILWKRRIPSWYPHLWPFKSGHAQLPRRLVAVGSRVYVTLALNAPLTALEAATGETFRTYDGTENTEEVIASEGILFLVASDEPNKPKREFKPVHRNIGEAKARVAKEWPWDEKPRRVMAIETETGNVLWQERRAVVPLTLAADGRGVYFHDGQKIVRLDRRNGKEIWASEPVSRLSSIPTKYGCTLVVHRDVVLFAGGDRKMWALSVKDGKTLWTAEHHRGGHNSPEDLLVLGGLAWSGEIAGGRHSGVFTGHDLVTGEVKNEFTPDVETYWFHHRCHRAKATDRYLLTSRTGIEFVDPGTKHWETHHWVRGGCLYGIMPANGLIYAPPHDCACYIIAKLCGMNALAPASKTWQPPREVADEGRLQRGPAYGKVESQAPAADDWPTYRRDAARSGHAKVSVSTELSPAWELRLDGRLSSLVVADGKVFVASVDTHTVHALDADSGEAVWSFTAGGRVDSPPTIYQGRALFGSADGYVYCLRTSDGALAWRFRAAPEDRRLTAFEQVESVWPVHGSVLVQNDVLYCVAGRSMFLDGGLRLLRLDPETGRKLSETILDDRDPETGENLQVKVRGLNMPTALPDILSGDGRYVYMRSQRFDLEGRRTEVATPADIRDQSGEGQHLFCGGGFLDGSWFHRIYWIYGKTVLSGAGGWPQAGRNAPAGRILCVGDDLVCGYGRKPEYYKWSTPLQYHLFAASKETLGGDESWVEVPKTASLNPAGKPVTVEAWVKAEQGDGVVAARGAGAHGYALFLKGGRPHFAVRVANELASVAAGSVQPQEIVGRWVHLAGVLTGARRLQVYVDGELAGSGEAPGLIAKDPGQTMQIGADEGGGVGDYESPFGLKGIIDEVRVYHRALGADEIRNHCRRPARPRKDAALVLYYSFDRGRATDGSGKKNRGKAYGATVAEGRLGKALRFRGSRVATVRPGRARTRVQYSWSESVPLHVRAMVLAGKTLFLAGPRNLIDEEEVFDAYGDAKVDEALEEQRVTLEGRKGAVLWAVSAEDGKKLAEVELTAPPAWDGMAAARGRLYFSTTDGKVLCFGARE